MCQPMKKFECFGATKATRQRHFKTSSTVDEDGYNPFSSSDSCVRYQTHVLPGDSSYVSDNFSLLVQRTLL